MGATNMPAAALSAQRRGRFRLNRDVAAGRRYVRYLCLAAYLLMTLGLLSGCAGTGAQTVSPGSAPTDQIQMPTLPPGVPTTLRVPDEYPTIQAAVDAARPGQMILIAPQVYHEAVRVKTPGITIRGQDRNRVILDGSFQLSNAPSQVTIPDFKGQNLLLYLPNKFFINSLNSVCCKPRPFLNACLCDFNFVHHNYSSHVFPYLY